MQRFAKPWYRLRALRVFPDDASLSANPDLWGSIQRALDDSGYFILLASLAAAESPWMAKEAEYWLEHRGTERMLVVLTEGDLFWDSNGHVDGMRTSALPAPLDGAFAEEPRYVDLRWARSDTQLAQRDARFRNALADLAAPIHGRSKDEMLGEDVRQHKRTLAVAWSAAALLAALAIGASALAVLAVQARDRARTQANIALSRQLAAESAAQLDGPSAVSPLLALESYRRVQKQPAERSYDARNALLEALQRSPRLLATLPASRLRAADFSPDGVAPVLGESGYRLTTGSHGRVLLLAKTGDGLRIVDVLSGTPVGPTLRVSGDFFVDVATGGRTLASGTSGSVLGLWNVRGAKVVAETLPADQGDYATPVFSADGTKLASVGADGTVRLWDPRGVTSLATKTHPAPRGNGLSEAATAVALGGHGRTAVGDSTSVTFWDAAGFSPTRRPSTWGATDLTFSADDKLLASAGSNGSIDIWNVTEHRVLASLPSPRGGYGWSLAFSTDGREVTTRGANGVVAVWDISHGKPTLQSRTKTKVALPPPACPGADPSRKYESCPEDPTSAVSTPDGILVYGTSGAGVKFWDLVAGHSLGALNTKATSVALAPDGLTLATVSGDTVSLWDVSRRQPLGRPLADPAGVASVAFESDGIGLASGGDHGTVTVWDPLLLSTGFEAWRARLCRLAGRNLTRTEWAQFLPGEPYRTTCPGLP